MDYVVYVIVRIVQVLLYIVDIAMLVRAVLSLFMLSDDNPLAMLAYSITEPFIMPIRALFDKLGWFEGVPIDMPFLITCMIIMTASMLL
ncbi:MAG: YggT family protein [Clostridia bacterium]|nr:YggT family protein [Clostridia bacterium]